MSLHSVPTQTRHSPDRIDPDAMWTLAIREAGRLAMERDVPLGKGQSPGEVLAKLRESLNAEIVEFHQALRVDGPTPAASGWERWVIGVPVSLFPKRSQGFGRVECAIEFFCEGEAADSFRVTAVSPKSGSVVVATGSLGGDVAVSGGGKVGLDVPMVPVNGKADGKVSTSWKAHFEYEITRDCTVAEIIRGTGAKWRLDDPQKQQKLVKEAHQFEVTLEVKPGLRDLRAAGVLQAFSKTNWLAADVSSIVARLSDAIRKFFVQQGAPKIAEAEWSNVLGRVGAESK